MKPTRRPRRGLLRLAGLWLLASLPAGHLPADEPPETFHLRDRFQEQLTGEFSPQGPVESVPGGYQLGAAGSLTWKTQSGAQFGLELTVSWPAQRIEAPTELELILGTQGLLEFGSTSLGVGRPCGVMFRSLHLDGEFLWEITLRAYNPALRSIEVLNRKLIRQADHSGPLRCTYNFGEFAVELPGGDWLPAHLDNFTSEIREITIRNSGLPVTVTDIRGSRSRQVQPPGFFERLRLGRAAMQDASVVELIGEEKLEQALSLQRDLNQTVVSILGDSHFYAVRTQSQLGELLRRTGRSPEARQVLAAAKAAAEAELGPDHFETTQIVQRLAVIELQEGNWEAAEPLLRSVHAARQRKGKHSFDEYLEDVAEDREAEGDWSSALLVREKIVALRELAYPAGHWQLLDAAQRLRTAAIRRSLSPEDRQAYYRANSLTNSAANKLDRGQLHEALQEAREAFAIRERLFGREHRDTANAITHISLLLKQIGEYEESLRYSRMDLEITGKILGQEHPEYATVMNNLAQTMLERQDLAEAERLHREALAIREENLERDPDEFAQSLSNLGRLYAFSMNRPELGLPLLEQAHQVRRLHFASDSIEVSRSLNNLGHGYMRIGDVTKAETLYREALRIKQAAEGERSLGLAQTSLALGNVLSMMGRYEEAKPHLEYAVETIQALAGVNNTYYPQYINYLAGVEANLGDPAGALARYQESLRIRAGQAGEEHIDCGEIRLNIARTLIALERYDEALEHVLASQRIILATVGRNHRAYPAAQRLLIDLKLRTGADLEEAFVLNSSLLDAAEEPLRARLNAMSEAQQLAQLRDLRSQLHQHLALGFALGKAPQPIYQRVLSWKSVIALQNLAFQMVESSELTQLRQRLGDVRRRLAAYALRRDEADSLAYLEGLQQLEAEKERLQRTLVRTAEAARTQWDRSPRQLAEELPPGAALVDFLEVHDGRRSHYQAFLLQRPQSDADEGWLTWFDLGSAETAVEQLARWREAIADGGDDRQAARALHRQLWRPLADRLRPDVQRVYLCPDGELSALPWAALPGQGENDFLLEDYVLASLPLAQYLAIQAPLPPSSTEELQQVLLVGNLDYDRGGQRPAGPEPTLLATRSLLLDEQQAWNFPPLPATAREIDAIESLAGTRPVTRLTGAEGNTAATLEQLRLAQYAHFATHGFFAGAGRRETAEERAAAWRRATLVRNPFLSSGLILAGANQQAAGDPASRAYGVLSAEAIASLPLDGLLLATLSACETQLGQISGGEGVYGLQRAFHLAGARHVVASLWKVEDQATAALMQLFYNFHWRHGLSPAEALREAQLTLLRQPSLAEDPGALGAALLRGPAFGKRVKVENAEATPADAEPPRSTGRIRQWAAFSVSGV